MDLPTILACAAAIAVGVFVIIYILFRTPKSAARIGSPAEIRMGDLPTPEGGDEVTEEEPEPNIDDTATPADKEATEQGSEQTPDEEGEEKA